MIRGLETSLAIGNRMRRFICIVAFCLTSSQAATASSPELPEQQVSVASEQPPSSYQMFAASLGSSMGMNHIAGVMSHGTSAFNLDLNLRMKLAYVLGLEFGYSPTDQRFQHEGMVYGGQLKLSGLLYVVPTRYVSAYVKGGIEGNGFEDLFDHNGSTSSYHVGVGLDIELDGHWVLGLEYLMLIPGITSVERAVQAYIDDELVRLQSAQVMPTTLPSTPGADDFISGSNFRLTVSARYYF